MNFDNTPETINDDLLVTYRHKQCALCNGRYMVAAHHRIKRQRCRIDLPWNLVALCMECHEPLHANERQFMREVKVHSKSEYSKMKMKAIYDYLMPDKNKVNELLDEYRKGLEDE